MKQEDLLEKIRKSAQHLSTPEALEPERLMVEIERNIKNIKIPWWKCHSGRSYRYGAALAACALVLMIWGSGGHMETNPEQFQAPVAAYHEEITSPAFASYDQVYEKLGEVKKNQVERMKEETMAAVPSYFSANIQEAAGDQSRQIQEFYINGTYASVAISVFDEAGNSDTVLETYDISKPEEPNLLGTISQDGEYETSWQSGDYVYLITEMQTDLSAGSEAKDQYIPTINGILIPSDNIYLPKQALTDRFLTVSSVNMRRPEQTVDQVAALTGADHLYVSETDIYTTADTNQERFRFSYKEGQIDWVEEPH